MLSLLIGTLPLSSDSPPGYNGEDGCFPNDAGLYANPINEARVLGMKKIQMLLVLICRTILASAFWLAIRVGSSLEISGVTYDKGLPRTYLGMTHKRDIDPFILVPTIVFHRGFKALAHEVRFALRADGFTTGFLGRIVTRPAWLKWALRPLSVGPILRWLGTYPIEGLVRPAEEWVREVRQVEGDLRAETMLSPAFLRDFAQTTRLTVEQAGQLTLSQMLAWRYHQALQGFYGPEILQGSKRRHIEQRVVERIHTHLAAISTCFWQGGTFFGAPEGQLSPDGHIGSPHAGFHRTMRASPPDLRVVPISLMYDFMTTGRQRIFVDFAPTLEYAAKMPQDALDTQIRISWLWHAHFTCTQLASGFLLERQRTSSLEFTLDECVHAVHQQACMLHAEGRHVDPLLLQLARAARRVRQYLAYVERRGLVQREAKQRWRIAFGELAINVGLRQVGYDDVPLLYAYNELQDLLSVPRMNEQL